MTMTVKTYDCNNVLRELLRDPELRQAYDESKREFDEIRQGLLEAIAFASGDTTGSVVHTPPPGHCESSQLSR